MIRPIAFVTGARRGIGRAIAALLSGAPPFTTGDACHIDGHLHIQWA